MRKDNIKPWWNKELTPLRAKTRKLSNKDEKENTEANWLEYKAS